jgi:hypothetical protein
MAATTTTLSANEHFTPQAIVLLLVVLFALTATRFGRWIVWAEVGIILVFILIGYKWFVDFFITDQPLGPSS